MSFIRTKTALFTGLTALLLSVSAMAQTSLFEETFIETVEFCIGSTDDECEELVLGKISQVRSASQGEWYDFELTIFAASIADAWDDSMSLSVCSRLADALLEISESVESDTLASNIAILSTVIRECEGIGIIADELLASPDR